MNNKKIMVLVFLSFMLILLPLIFPYVYGAAPPQKQTAPIVVKSAYFTNLIGQKVLSSQIGDKVDITVEGSYNTNEGQLEYPSESKINVTVYRHTCGDACPGGVCLCQIDEINKTTLYIHNNPTWKVSWIWQPSEANTLLSDYYYFNISSPDLTQDYRSDNNLDVSNEENNSAPVVNITSPTQGAFYNITTQTKTIDLWLNATAYDEDDMLVYFSWAIYNQTNETTMGLVYENETTNLSKINITYPLGPGSYSIFFEVMDERNATGIAKIDVVVYEYESEQAPIAIIADPIFDQTIDTTVNVTLDGSQSYDPDDCNSPSCDGAGIKEYYWLILKDGDKFLELDNTNSIINVSLTGSTTGVVNYTVYLGVVDDEGNMSYTLTNFSVDLTNPSLCTCDDNGNAVSCGGCIDSTHRCNETGNIVEDCIMCSIIGPQGPQYGCSQDKMCTNSSQCRSYANCPSSDGTCYTDNGETKSCQDINDRGTPSYCGGYDEVNCVKDPCLASLKDCLENDKCVSALTTKNNFDAGCQWNASANKCEFFFNWTDSNNNNEKCVETRDVAGQCTIPGQTLTTTIKWRFEGNGDVKQLCGSDMSQKSSCPQSFAQKAPFFSWFNGLAVIIILSFYYFLAGKRKSKKK